MPLWTSYDSRQVESIGTQGCIALHIYVATLNASLIKMNRNVGLVMNKFLNPKSVMAAMHVSGTETGCQANSQTGNSNLPRVGSSADDDDPLLRLPEVLKRVPVSRSHWWAGVASGRFPAPVRLSVRCVAWRASSIRALIASL